MKSLLLVVAFLLVSYWASDIRTADFGPKPIKDTGLWNDPSKFILLYNSVHIKLNKEDAHIKACFFFECTYRFDYWNKGKLEWAWPLPSKYPRPEQLKIISDTFVFFSEFDVAKEVEINPCFFYINDNRKFKPYKLESFTQLDIYQWYVFQDDFLIFMPGPILGARIRIDYHQKYKWNKDGTGSMLYVLRTGSLWAGSIRQLNINIEKSENIELVRCNWKLIKNKIHLTNIEPKKDLLITIRRKF